MNNNYINGSIPYNYNNSNNEYIPNEQSYIENILRVNKGKKVSIYQSFADSNEWRNKVFTGTIMQSGKDHIILKDTNTGNWYLLLMIYVDYIKFDEEINTIDQFYPQLL